MTTPGPVKQSQRRFMNRQMAKLAVSVGLLAAGWYYTLVLLPAGIRAMAGPSDDRPTATIDCCGRDFYPSWYAARLVWFEHRSPYTEEATRAIQQVIYGRPIEGTAIRVQQRFAYPLFAIIPLTPLAWLSFATAQKVLFGIFVSLVIASTLLWARVMAVRCTPALCALVLASYPVIMGIALYQPTVLYLFLLALAAHAAKSSRFILAGTAAAFAVAKPQLAVAVLVPLFFWTVADWPRRKRVALGFTATLALQVGVATLLQPGWFPDWLTSLEAYRSYAPTPLLLPSIPGVAVGIGVALVLILWRVRRDLELALALAVSGFQFIAPFQIYNEAILLPAVFWIWRRRDVLAASMLPRMAYRLGVMILGSAMITAVLISIFHSFYQLPVLLFIALGFMPLLVMAVHYWQQTFHPAPAVALAKAERG